MEIKLEDCYSCQASHLEVISDNGFFVACKTYGYFMREREESKEKAIDHWNNCMIGTRIYWRMPGKNYYGN